MAEIKLNKTELKKQKTLKDQLTKYLPTLQLKKQQLQAEVEYARQRTEAIEIAMTKLQNDLKTWSVLFSQKLTVNLFEFLQIEEIETEKENIAGVDIPVFKNLKFHEKKYSIYMMPVWFDRGIAELRNLITLREEQKIAKNKMQLLEEELRQTNIKVNLFEKRMIPECTENIRKIKIFLGDQEIAAICNAKIAKDKLKRKEVAGEVAA